MRLTEGFGHADEEAEGASDGGGALGQGAGVAGEPLDSFEGGAVDGQAVLLVEELEDASRLVAEAVAVFSLAADAVVVYVYDTLEVVDVVCKLVVVLCGCYLGDEVRGTRQA